MQPVVTADEMTACDAAALKTISHDVLVRRAGMAVGFAVGIADGFAVGFEVGTAVG